MVKNLRNLKNHIPEYNGGECVFAVYLANYEKYENETLTGEWVELPTTPEKIREVFKRLGIAESKEAVVVKVEEVEIRGIRYGVEDGESLEKLQYLADLVTRLNENDRNLFEAIIEAMVDCAYCIDDMINLTYNIHKYEVTDEVWDGKSFGEYYLEKAGFCDAEIAFGVWLSDYIDYDRLEDALLQKENGEYTKLGFITSIDGDFEEVFDGSVENIPEEIRLFPEED